MTAFLMLLTSKNGLSRTTDDLSRLNQHRKAEGKRPLCEFINTRLDLSRSRSYWRNRGETNTSPMRRHLVRGHFKVRKSGVFWWSPFFPGQSDWVPRQHHAVSAEVM